MTEPPPPPAYDGEPLGAVLHDREIRRLVSDRELIDEFQEGSLSGASYDLALGKETFTRGEHRTLTYEHPSILLEPGQFALVMSKERLRLPKDIVGHAGLISTWAQRGLISLFSPQIDPGFVGHVVVPLFNAGDAPITLKFGELMFTTEFVRTTEPASRAWVEDHPPLETIPAGVEVRMAAPDLGKLTERVNGLEAAVQGLERELTGYQSGAGHRMARWQTVATWIGIIVAIVLGVIALL